MFWPETVAKRNTEFDTGEVSKSVRRWWPDPSYDKDLTALYRGTIPASFTQRRIVAVERATGAPNRGCCVAQVPGRPRWSIDRISRRDTALSGDSATRGVGLKAWP